VAHVSERPRLTVFWLRLSGPLIRRNSDMLARFRPSATCALYRHYSIKLPCYSIEIPDWHLLCF
jgi:hypothetical protein